MNCPICGKSISNKRKTCSKECAAKALRGGNMLVCSVCGKDFYLPPSRRTSKNFCSIACRKKHTSQKKTENPQNWSICLYCGISFQKTAASGLAKYCSQKCFREYKTRESQASSRNVVCVTCGKEFHAYRSNAQAKYCSRACRKTTKERQCKSCGKVFQPHGNKRSFCSRECANKGMITSVVCICKSCGKIFTVTKSMKERGKGVYCSQKCMYSSESWKKGALKGRIAQGKMKGDNSLEKSGNAILDAIGITYTKQYSIGNKFIVDVFLPEHNTVIQWDGDYWHGYKGVDDKRVKKRVALDISQDAYMKTLGIKVLRFWEHDVKNNKEYVIKTITDSIYVKGTANA